MRIELNGDGVDLDSGVSVLALLARQGIDSDTKGVAVAVNSEVVPRNRWNGKVLAEGDRVDVIRAVAGG